MKVFDVILSTVCLIGMIYLIRREYKNGDLLYWYDWVIMIIVSPLLFCVVGFIGTIKNLLL
jgi:hypothetical protein